MKSRLKKNKKIRKKIDSDIKDIKKVKRKRRRKLFLLCLILLIIFFILYARFIEPNFLITNETKIVTNLIDDKFNGLKIVHFSDLHYGSTIKEKQLKKVIDEINAVKPDIVVFTGDLIENKYKATKNELDLLIKEFSLIEARLGKYAVIGNHDFYEKNYTDILNQSDFKLLINDYDLVYDNNQNPIAIYGVDNITYGEPNFDKAKDLEFVNTNYKILILHEPDYVLDVLNLNDYSLVLAGHSHNQQINIPLIKGFWLPEYSKTYYDNYYEIEKTKLYVSNGIGTSFLKLRFNSIPSINFFRIIKEQ